MSHYLINKNKANVKGDPIPKGSVWYIHSGKANLEHLGNIIVILEDDVTTYTHETEVYNETYKRKMLFNLKSFKANCNAMYNRKPMFGF